MNETALESVNNAVWLIPLLILVSLLFMAMLARFWREKAWVSWLQLSKQLEKANLEYNALVERNLEYRTEEREPYGKRGKILDGQLIKINQQLESQAERLSFLHERMDSSPDNIFQALFGGVFGWYGLRKDLAELEVIESSIDALLNLAGETLASLDDLVRRMAQESRQAVENLELIVRRSDLLSDWRAHGRSLERFDERLDRLHAAFALLPEGFISGSSEKLEALDRSTVVQAYETIVATRPVFHELAQLSHSWLSLLRKIEEALNPVGKKLESMGIELGKANQIDLSGLSREIMENIRVYESLMQQLDRPDVDILETLYAEAVKLQKQVAEIDDQYRQTLKKYSGFSRAYVAALNGLDHLERELAYLETTEMYPIRWEMTRHKIGVLRKRLTDVGALDKARSLEKVEQDSEIVTDIGRQIEQFIHKTANIRQVHGCYVRVLQDNLLQNGEVWIEESRALVKKIGYFDLINFAPDDRIEHLAPDLERLLLKQRKHFIPHPSIQVGETEIEKHLQDLEQLLEEHKVMRDRVKRIGEQHHRLNGLVNELSAKSAAMHDWLAACRSMLEREKIIRRMSEADLAVLANQVHQVDEALEHISQGDIQEKVKLAATLENEAGKTARRWLKFLSDGLADMQASLRKSLEYLDGVAQLDEPCVEQARKLVGPENQYTATPDLTLDKQKDELDRLTQTWTAGLVTYRSLEELESLVAAAVESTDERRQSCQGILRAAEKVIPVQPGWPPLTQSLDHAKQEWGRIEASWDSLLERKLSSGWLVKELGSIERAYQQLEGEISRIRFQADQEILKVQERETELAGLIESWRAIQMSFNENPGVRRVIDMEIEAALQTKKSIEQRYKRGILDYDKALKSLALLCQQTGEKWIDLGDGTRTNIKGEISIA